MHKLPVLQSKVDAKDDQMPLISVSKSPNDLPMLALVFTY